MVPASLQRQVLEILHLGHFGIQRMKQLAKTAIYWPGIDKKIGEICHACTSCAEHQNKPAKPAVHPWMIPEKPWSRLYLDHAINFLGTNWLVLVDAYSKYPCVHPTSSVSTKSTTDLLEAEFAHFGFPHTIVTDNATTFTSGEFQEWCRKRGIIHLTGAPYHPATNGAAERLVQTFKQALRKSSLPAKTALQEFVMQYRRTPLASGYSPSELLNGRQIRATIDNLFPSPAHQIQKKQNAATRRVSQETLVRESHRYSVGQPCFALYYGPRRKEKQPHWVPAVVTKVYGTRSVNVSVYPRGPTWRRHIEQLQPRYTSDEDNDPGESPSVTATTVPSEETLSTEIPPCESSTSPSEAVVSKQSPCPKFGPHNPRRSTRLQARANKKNLPCS